jgi:hypothetical protein
MLNDGFDASKPSLVISHCRKRFTLSGALTHIKTFPTWRMEMFHWSASLLLLGIHSVGRRDRVFHLRRSKRAPPPSHGIWNSSRTINQYNAGVDTCGSQVRQLLSQQAPLINVGAALRPVETITIRMCASHRGHRSVAVKNLRALAIHLNRCGAGKFVKFGFP